MVVSYKNKSKSKNMKKSRKTKQHSKKTRKIAKQIIGGGGTNQYNQHKAILLNQIRFAAAEKQRSMQAPTKFGSLMKKIDRVLLDHILLKRHTNDYKKHYSSNMAALKAAKKEGKAQAVAPPKLKIRKPASYEPKFKKF